MLDDVIFSVPDAIMSNLERLSREHSILTELKAYELRDVALAMAVVSDDLFDGGLDASEILSLFSETLDLGSYPLSDDTTPAVRSLISKNRTSLAMRDRELLTELYLDAVSGRHPITERDFLPSSLGEETFTYVRNLLSDEAYDVFSQDFTDPKVRYSRTFRDAARSVAAGEVTYCLLPLEERGGVRLHTVSELIFRNDFKINSVIPVFGPDGNADVKYALVSKSFTVPERKADDDLYLELRIGAGGSTALTELLSAVDYYGMSIYRVNTLTFETEGESETYFSVVIKGTEGDFTPILAYMTLFLRDFVPVGIYKNLE